MVLFKITIIFHDSPKSKPKALSISMILLHSGPNPILQGNKKRVHRLILWDKESP